METILRLKFWLAMGLVVTAGLGLLVVGIIQGAENRTMASAIDKDLQKVEGIQEVKNPLWADREKKLTANYEKQLNDIEAELSVPDVTLDRRFDEESDPDEPRKFGEWRHIYPKKANELRERLVNAVDEISSAPLTFHSVPSTWMENNVMAAWEKEYWLQEVIVRAIERTNRGLSDNRRVLYFGTLKFAGSAAVPMRKAHSSGFRCHGFTFDVHMRYMDVPSLLEQLLRDPLHIEITSVYMTNASKATDSPEEPVLAVVIAGYIPEHAAAAKGRSKNTGGASK